MPTFIDVFNTVLADVFAKLISKETGPQIPNFLRNDKYEEAKLYTLSLASKGTLLEYFNRLQKGTI